MDCAFDKISTRGYQRIGFSLPHNAIKGVDSNWMAGYLVAQAQLPQSRCIPPFIGSIHDTELKSFSHWYERWRPDALITLLGEEMQWLKEMGLAVPKDLALVCLTRPQNSPFSGIENNEFAVGAAACEMVLHQMIHNERGPPALPKTILIEGEWCEGNSLPKKNDGIRKRRRAG